MTDIPVCKLCDCAPLPAGQLGEDVFVRHTENSCPVNSKRIFKVNEWTALMGDQTQAIANKVCRDIPNRFTVCIVLEKDAGYVELWRGNHERFELDCDGGIEDQIENAMAVAMGEQQ